MVPWHQRRPERLATELQAALKSGLLLRFERYSMGIVGWRGTIEMDGQRHFLQVLYPPDFPVRPPWVRETEALTDEGIDDKGTYHQMVDGSLCLFALGTGPDSWSPQFTICDVIDRYREFRRLADVHGHVDEHGLPLPNAPGLPLSQVLQITPGQQEVLRLPRAWGRVFARRLGHGAAFVAGRVENSARDVVVDQDLAPWATAGLSNDILVMPWLAVECKRWNDIVPDLRSVDALVATKLPEEFSKTPAGCLLLVYASIDTVRLLCLERIVLPDGSRVLLRHEVAVVDMPAQLFARIDGAMAGREALVNWHVVMVGLGSLGGAVALHLAKAGVSRFTLFDPDRIAPENVARHVVGIGGLFLHKTAAIARMLRDRNPSASVQQFASSPLWDGSPVASRAIEQLLADTDTIFVVTTADEAVERAINVLAHLHDRPVVFASVIGQAEQGRVQRVLPWETPCYECIAHQQHRHPDRFFRAKDCAPLHPPAMAGYRQPGIPGIGLDVEAIAILAARIVLQTLVRLGDGQPDYPDTEHHHLVWTSRPDEAFDHALQVRWELYERDPTCNVCAEAGDNAGVTADTNVINELEALLSDPARLVLDNVPLLPSSNYTES